MDALAIGGDHVEPVNDNGVRVARATADDVDFAVANDDAVVLAGAAHLVSAGTADQVVLSPPAEDPVVAAPTVHDVMVEPRRPEDLRVPRACVNEVVTASTPDQVPLPSSA